MGLKFWLTFLVLATAVVAHSSSAFESYANPVSYGEDSVGDLVAEDEMSMDSEVNHRLLAAARRYISYGALKKDSVPCNRRGQSYYNCNRMKKANPYKRGCSVITHCKRFTG
ncbi:hypothetical protein MLD38_010053 [Melastoma candidum]|uniref:Uncharacterized protein n=1 Tax=Melastoma candidum TaxID=119954 RepID=A0ACB9R1P2_9MYRT|nr:hypothetical protein MLD38_010053 [Melastoma candidum]